jgi:hypothetical protein
MFRRQWLCGYLQWFSDSYGESLPVLQLDQTSPKCVGETLNLYGNMTNTPNIVGYEWSGPDGFVFNGERSCYCQCSVVNSGVYYLTVTDAKGCENSTARQL